MTGCAKRGDQMLQVTAALLQLKPISIRFDSFLISHTCTLNCLCTDSVEDITKKPDITDESRK